VLVSALERVSGPVALITYTAPGENFHGVPARNAIWQREWNSSMPRRRKRLHAAITNALARAGHQRLPVLAWVVQRQSRGLDHMHLVVSAATALERAAIAAYVVEYRRLTEHDWRCNGGRRYGFGFIDDPFLERGPKSRNMIFGEASRAGHYLSRYLVEGAQIALRTADQAVKGRVLWVSPVLMRKSGVTMARLRRVRHAWWVVRALEQGSYPTMPQWWGNMRERRAVIALLRPAALAAT
jgi:hypothetical protein